MDATKLILERFEQISSVPRGTKREEKISRWLQDWAEAHGFLSRVDARGNLAIYVPARAGLEGSPAIVLQGHMDMVCEKTPDSDHDFTRDPIRCIREGDWLHADRTTLGADNGIAIAMALALAEDQEAIHPPLELLFTVEEEIGLGGVSELDPTLISGKTVINLDSEDEGSFIVGCAGGTTTRIELAFSQEAFPSGYAAFRLGIGGLQGGHSGVDIHKLRASANKILGRSLDRLAREHPIQLVSLKGGTARNAIAREAEVVIACPAEKEASCREALEAFERDVRHEYSKTDSGLSVSLARQAEHGAHALSPGDSTKLIEFLTALPHGVIQMSASIEGFVETSTNLAMLELSEGKLHVTTNQRSMVMSRLNEINRQVEAIARLAGAEVTHLEAYPAWQPDMDSPLLGRSVNLYESLFGQKPEVKMIHAGLECGILNDCCGGGLDMISIGPTIQNPHSPEERLYIPSVERVWTLVGALLRTLPEKQPA